MISKSVTHFEKIIKKKFVSVHSSYGGFPGGPMVKHVPAMQETQDMRVQDVGWEVPLEEEMATHSSILGGKSHTHRVAKSRIRLSTQAPFH